MTEPIQEIYGNRLRVRACGLLIENERLLMVNHKSLTETDFWAPPGGGVNFGESASLCLQRELREETGLETKAGEFLFACEFIQKPLHAIELFFLLERVRGNLLAGRDPEMKKQDQIIKAVQFLHWDEIQKMNPNVLHGIFRFTEEPAQITRLRGYFKL
jgi:ADP-ribose pyrophosphatase YjhB (NUDIX family)